jgi:hypothetical protein
MPAANEPTATLKQKVLHETEKMVGYTIYLTVVIGIFNYYRRLVLKEYEITYLHYGYGLIEALILAKVILIGEALKLGERTRALRGPLAIPTLYKSLMFGILVAIFTVLEKLVIGAIHHEDLARIALDVVSKGKDEILARILIMFVAFVPFFAFLELQQELKVDYFELFFRRRPEPNAVTTPRAQP